MREYVTDLQPTPPPWKLRGTGYVLLYWFQRYEFRLDAFTQPGLAEHWRGGLGALTWMDYRESPVGPYREILFIPGRFAFNGRRDWSISRIYVETLASVIGGRANWGIPKDLATFTTEQRPDGTEILGAAVDDRPIAELRLHGLGPAVPIDTAFLPLSLMQRMNDQIYYTELTLRARVRWLDVLRVWTDPTDAALPGLKTRRPLAAVKLEDFDVTFPVPRTEPDTAAAIDRLREPDGSA